jgi:hypothetical protein
MPLCYHSSLANMASALSPLSYFVSRCGWCLRQYGQNFFISNRSVVVFLFFVLL